MPVRHPRPHAEVDLGRIVLYRPSNPSAAVVPAVVCATPQSAREHGAKVGPSEGRVDLVQLSPETSQQLGATYVARNVPEDSHYAGRRGDVAMREVEGYYSEDAHTPGTWRWRPADRNA